MHDQPLEARLRAVLHDEGDGLPFTITTADLERRLLQRRRGRPGRLSAVGIAAAATVALVGLAAVVGSRDDHGPIDPGRPSATAVSSGRAAVTPGPTDPPPPAFPTLGELVGQLDPRRLVRMGSAGPFGSPPDDVGVHGKPIEAGSMTLDPMTEAGTYRIRTVCLGAGPIAIEVMPAGGQRGIEALPIACDSATTVRDLRLDAGDAVRVTHPAGVGWRLSIEAEQPTSAQPPAYEPIGAPDDGWAELARSVNGVIDPDVVPPSYAEPAGGHDVNVQYDGMAIPARDEYEILVSCAGPGTVRYHFDATLADVQRTGEFGDYAAGGTVCDGRVHRDRLDVALPSGSLVYVLASQRIAFEVVIRAKTPPIAVATDEGRR
jgi:hypothetical protein